MVAMTVLLTADSMVECWAACLDVHLAKVTRENGRKTIKSIIKKKPD